MSKRKKNIEEFFNDYESHFNKGILNQQLNVKDEIARSFENCFIESSPAGVICGKNDDQFVEKIKSGFAFYKSIGSKGMNIVSKDIALLDDLHALVKVYWRYSYIKDDKEGAIDFTNYYLVTTNDQVKIFAYIAGDEQKALSEKGLAPQAEAVVS
jgi:hypothetical protein